MLYEQGGAIRGMNIYLDGDTLYAGGWNSPSRESGWKGDWVTYSGIVPGEWNHVVLSLDANLETAVENDKTLSTRWIHVNGGGQFIVGTEDDRYDQGTFTLELTGTDKYHDPVVPMRMPNGMIMEREIQNNDGFLMTGGKGRVQFYGEEKLSFTKLHDTVGVGAETIVVENVIERNFSMGDMRNGKPMRSPTDDGQLNWEEGDQIVIASTSYDYREEEVRTITKVDKSDDDATTTLTLDYPLEYRHYGQVEEYGKAGAATNPGQVRKIDMRAEVALLSRNIKITGLAEQDTDVAFGDRANLQTEARVTASGLSPFELVDENGKPKIPAEQAKNGVGGHVMFMKGSGDIVVDGVQLDRLGQASQKGRYPIHWHLAENRENDIFRNSSVTNSNNRGVTIHGTNNLSIEGVVVHDVHGHGFFFEDAVETGNKLVGNLVLGVHAVGGHDANYHSPGEKDPFVVDTHDSLEENRSRFSASAAYWITNPKNTFVGNIAAGAGDQRTQLEPRPDWIDESKVLPAGTGFWYAIPRTAVGESSREDGGFEDYQPIYEEFGKFDYNTSHTTAIGLNFDKGSDIEDANFGFKNEEGDLVQPDFNSIQLANQYKPTRLIDPDNPELGRIETRHFVDHFTNYKASEAAVYHRGEANSIRYRGLRIADSYNGPWAVSETQFLDSLYVGHSMDNAGEKTAEVGGPRLYDGAGNHVGAHFAGFGADSAYTFQVEGSSFGPTMYHTFPRVSFEPDGTFEHMAHAVSDFSRQHAGRDHNLGAPQEWSKAAIDVDGSLTGPEGGVGYSIVPNVDFLVDADDVKPEGWDAYLTDDIYTRIRVQNNDDGVELFPDGGETSMVFTAQDGDQIEVTAGQNNGNLSWAQVAAKVDDEGTVDGTFTIAFGEQGLPKGGFALNVKNQDGNWINQNNVLFQRVRNARIVIKIDGGYNYTPLNIDEVEDNDALRAERSKNVFFRSAEDSSLYINTGITDEEPIINFVKTGDDALQTIYELRPEASRTVSFGTVIEAEHFDNGTKGVAYHDNDSGNESSNFRNSDVDATATAIGNITDGEWLEYTTDIIGGAYDLGVNYSATEPGGKVRVLAGKRNDAGYLRELGTVSLPVTGQESTGTEWLKASTLPLLMEKTPSFDLSSRVKVLKWTRLSSGLRHSGATTASNDTSQHPLPRRFNSKSSMKVDWAWPTSTSKTILKRTVTIGTSTRKATSGPNTSWIRPPLS